MTKIIQTDEARQGRSGRQVLFVLIGALALTVIVWAGVEMYGQVIDQTPQGQTSDQTVN